MTDFKAHRAALSNLREALSKSVLFVHYSCESFYDYSKPGSRRITSIAVRFGDSSQTKSFSIHQAAERLGLLPVIMDSLDRCERAMLDDFDKFAREHQKAYTWLHWNMRDANYGFEAIAHRHRVLGGEPVEFTDERKLDLSPTLIDIYGKNYTGHPRIEWLFRRNDIFRRAFLTGGEEAEAFATGNFVAMHQSTLVKVQGLAEIAQLASEQKLKTQSRMWRDVYSSSLSSIGQSLAANWVFIVVVALLGLAFGALGAAPTIAQLFASHRPPANQTVVKPPAEPHAPGVPTAPPRPPGSVRYKVLGAQPT